MMTSMRFRHELSYDASPAAVFEMLADPAFREKVGEALDVVSSEVTIERDGDGFTLVNEQVQRTAGLPSFAKKIAGDTTRVIQREEWRSTTSGTLQVETPGKPTSMSGTIELVPDGEGTVEVVEIEVRAKVPLIGGKLESLMQQQVRDGMDTEREVGQAWLKGNPA
jgi:carbon monoxide dehydrogenase subunit G